MLQQPNTCNPCRQTGGTDDSQSNLRFCEKLIERLTSFNEALIEPQFLVEVRQAKDQIAPEFWYLYLGNACSNCFRRQSEFAIRTHGDRSEATGIDSV